MCDKLIRQSSFPWILYSRSKEKICRLLGTQKLALCTAMCALRPFQQQWNCPMAMTSQKCMSAVPSKSTVPEPSESISSIMPSNSWSVNWSSNSRKISFKHVVGMKPLPSLSYKRKASFNSFCMASASSSTMNLAASWTNSTNSKRPDSVLE